MVFDPSLAFHQLAETTAPTCSSLIPCTELHGGEKPPIWQPITRVVTGPTVSFLWFDLFYCSALDLNLRHHSSLYFHSMETFACNFKCLESAKRELKPIMMFCPAHLILIELKE